MSIHTAGEAQHLRAVLMDVSHLDGHGWPQRVFVVPNFCVFFLVLSATISASENKKVVPRGVLTKCQSCQNTLLSKICLR